MKWSSVGKFVGIVLCALLVPATACDTESPPHVTLRVLASSELADMRPLLDHLRRDTGIELVMDYRGTIEATDAMEPGRYQHDVAWLSTSRYFEMTAKQRGYTGELPLTRRFMFSPLAIGVKPEVADGIENAVRDRQVSWADLADRSAMGMLRYAMADPARSAGGLAALIGVATAAAGTGGPLREADISCDRLRGFLLGRTLSADTSQALAAAYTADQNAADALIDYESVLLSMNASGTLREPLRIVYPRDGIILADYPMMLLDRGKRDAFETVVTWFESERAQREIMEKTSRRPLTRPYRDSRFPDFGTNTLYFPDRRETIDRLIADYSNPRTHIPTHVIFALDFSASMSGPRMAELRATFAGLRGADPSTAGKFVRLYRGEELTIMRFGGRVLDEREFRIAGQSDLDAIGDYLAVDSFDETTGVWSALDAAYEKVAALLRDRGERAVTIVVMTDGENNTGIGVADFLRAYGERAPEVRAVHTYTVRFGDAGPDELDRVARATGGRMVDATAMSLSEAFEEIRGCR
ncbi:substrate-binding and vWA domain-containing protein [Nocardia bovistercoris]|uniref:VWA domain-containing protein n=1 Tax=Nocardia bovistercoris TaxID=2785916 RepID=A0A931N4X0_9NOCA|nr:VWA domain-containing protein [Nocardia bovistercoris]MBH0778058.1 VWA domain-containing protein [Nocardia bovistercoris]